MPNTCLFIGRFQPFHIGHLLVIKGMTKTCDKIVIGIGSSNLSSTKENPFTASERKEMIQRSLQGEDIIPTFDVSFIEVPDVKSDEEWTKTCLELSGEITTVWSGNEVTKKCFEGTGVQIQNIKPVPGISGTEIRELMKSGGDWKTKVPPEVAAAMNAIDGVLRVREA